ncbi:cupin-like domain-containing protein [Fulvivirga ulvae]|uniref:cupin-like domain-containing protein n=1 Tax=Fulvivirga ulvae TaxID=2904245 RepID=UPI001F28E522|nr:cupin-like domain-containing protein [Fulvivirga ulvae]UII33623.1 cupin-like domain-containing protein [Fulvivirga ulvae]
MLSTDLEQELFSVIPGLENSREVTEVNAADLSQKTFYEQWVNKNNPCVIRGACKHWPASEKWSKTDFWKSSIKNFDLYVSKHRNFNDSERQNSGREKKGFHAAVDEIFSKGTSILSIPAEEINPSSYYQPLNADIAGFTFLPNPPKPRNYSEKRFFLYRGASTAWHYHKADETLMTQVVGAKKVMLLSSDLPDRERTIDFLENERQLEGKELDSFLKFESYIVEVREGDALYIPPQWFHAVVPVDMNAGVTLAYCWGSPWHKLGDLGNYFTRKLYRELIIPVNRYTLLIPFLGSYAFTMFLLYRIGLNRGY